MKKQRQDRIIELITSAQFQTQEEITEALNNEGFRVTQATVSRDLREMKLTKRALEGGIGYAYTLTNAGGSFDKIILSAITSVKYAINNVVIKTVPGLAPAVAAGIDALNDPSILGCVAGDDTIILITYDEVCSDKICNMLAAMMGEKKFPVIEGT